MAEAEAKRHIFHDFLGSGQLDVGACNPDFIGLHKSVSFLPHFNQSLDQNLL
jgi:hypothetical protein